VSFLEFKSIRGDGIVSVGNQDCGVQEPVGFKEVDKGGFALISVR
jgi:hypothetical protein